MLRLLVLLLLLANGLYFGWTQGFFKTYGWAPLETAEPQRLQQQIKPEAINVLAPEERRAVAAASSASTQPSECFKSGLIESARLEGVRRALRAWPTGTWQLDAVSEPGRWMVYMGKFANAEAQAKKRSELERMNVKLEPLQNAELELGLSLGGYKSQALAEEALAALQKRGVRTARVVQERPASQGGVLTIAAVDDALRPRLEALQTALGSVALANCP
jgi:hypothetical protein